MVKPKDIMKEEKNTIHFEGKDYIRVTSILREMFICLDIKISKLQIAEPKAWRIRPFG